MHAHDKPAFAELLTQALGFYGQTLSPFALTVWWQACANVDIEQLRRALTTHAMDPDRGQWAPKPADIVRQLSGTTTDRSLVAWGKVLDAIQRVGAYQSVVFDDGIIHAAVQDMGGWPQLCRSTTDELPFLQRRFCASYVAHAGRPDVQFPPRLVGDHEADNALRGRKTQPPVIVGDVERAREVQRMGREGPRVQMTVAGAVPTLRLARGGDAA